MSKERQQRAAVIDYLKICQVPVTEAEIQEELRLRALEAQGMTRSDAQGCV